MFDQLGRLRRATLGGGLRAPHKPLLLLWLLGQVARTGSSTVRYTDVEQPVSELISDFEPPRAGSSARYSAAMPFVYLERTLWQLTDGSTSPLDRPPASRRFLFDHNVTGRLRPEVELLLTDPATLAAAARLLLDSHFTPTLAELITDPCRPRPARPAGPRSPVGRQRAGLEQVDAVDGEGGRPREADRGPLVIGLDRLERDPDIGAADLVQCLRQPLSNGAPVRPA